MLNLRSVARYCPEMVVKDAVIASRSHLLNAGWSSDPNAARTAPASPAIVTSPLSVASARVTEPVRRASQVDRLQINLEIKDGLFTFHVLFDKSPFGERKLFISKESIVFTNIKTESVAEQPSALVV